MRNHHTMSTTTEATTTAATFDNQTTTTNEIRYTFKVTEENKTQGITVSLNAEVKAEIKDLVVDSPQWRSDAQFLIDALVYYLNDDSQTGESVREIVDDSEWNSEIRMPATITETLFEEIDLLVKHSHTAWNSKQVFYICAIKAYSEAGFPPMEQR